jgi:broad specificity phosphatase PhoE
VEPNGVKTEPKSAKELASVYGTIDDMYESVNPMVPDNAIDVPAGSPHFVETEEALLKRCATTIQRILDHSNGDNVAIVSHAPCDQAIAYYLEGAASTEESKLGPWPLGGITKFSRVGNGSWTMELYGSTDHMPGKYRAGLKEWSLPCLAKKSKN